MAGIYSRHCASSRCLIYSLIICSYIWLVCGGPHQPTTNNIVLIFICLVKEFYCTISCFLFNKLRLSLKLHISAFKTCLGVSLTFSYKHFCKSFIRAMSVRIRPWTVYKRVLIRSNPLASASGAY